ncbi:MAG TPA: amidase [Methylomirabilota bacterium]|nr:amidase [Methylomirabilota bacterium]
MKPWLDDASSLADAIRSSEVRAADALEASLDAIAASNLNAVVYLDADGARRTAGEIDRRVRAGEDVGPFGGVPVLVKDLEHVAGMPTTHGSVPFKDNVVDYDSIHAARLRAAGAVIVGKSAAPEFGLVAYTASKLHGVTRNPWNTERTPAGSSGGSAAAVAGGLVPIATATDGGGSIRLPAAYCGLVGLKGTFGRIPRGPRARNGQLTSLLGTVSRSVRDTARWYDVASGYDPRDPFSLPRIDGWEARLGTRDLRGLRAVVAPTLGNAVVHPEVESIVRDAAEALIDASGLRRVDLDVRIPEDGIAWARAGLPGLVADLEDRWPDCRDDLTFEIRVGMEFAPHYRAKHAAAVERFRVEMNEAMADLFERVDLLFCAVSPTEPFKAEGPMPTVVGEVKVAPWNGGALTIPASISGYPAISIPAGHSRSGLPVGLQVYARRHEEALLLDLAAVMERARPWPLTVPMAPV